MQELHNISRRGGSLIRVAAAAAAVLLAGSHGYANILSTSATVRPNNSLLVDVQVTTGASVERVSITYQTTGVDPLVSRLTQVSSTGSTTITIGRLQGKPDLHLHRGRIRPRWRSGGNRERELHDRPASSALVDEHLHAYRAHHGAPRHCAGQPDGLPGLRWLRPPLLRCAADRLVLQQRSEQRVRRTASRHSGIDRSGAEREYSLWGRRNGRSYRHRHFLPCDHARRDPSCRKPGRLQRDAADGLAESGGLDLGPGKRLA